MIGQLMATLAAGLLASNGAGDNKELETLARQAGTLKSYAFTVDQQPGPNAGKPVEGKYQNEQPVYFKAEGIEFYRKGEVLVYLDGGKWQRTRSGTLSDPLRILGASARVRAVATLPHEELAALSKDLAGVKKGAGKDKGVVVLTGTLTPEALKKWAPTEVRSVAQEGTVQVWAAEGSVTRYAVTLRLQGRLGNAEVDGMTTRTVELRAAGSTRVEVPAAARKALE